MPNFAPEETMSEPLLLVEESEGVALLTLNRPNVMNSFNFEMLRALRDAIESLRFNPAVRVIIITGAGDRAFCAGADLKERATLTPVQVKEFIFTIRNLFTAIEQLSKPVIAAVNGVALGGGTELALACDSASRPRVPPWASPKPAWRSSRAPAAPSACRAWWAGAKPRS
jgi:enoyl-CoA hydratase/carnithine racemase